MMHIIRNSSKLAMLLMVVMLLASGCKSKKKAMEAAAAEKARMEQEAATKKQQEEEAARKKAEADAAARARAEAEAAERERAANSTPAAKLKDYFSAIANASNATAANSAIDEALALFSAPTTPVLIVIAEENGQKDYDQPTTIKDYLNYLKDVKRPADAVSNLQFDSQGKITEVELKKK